MTPLSRDFFASPVAEVAAALIGTRLLLAGTGGIIVETEAYDRHDPASHSVNGPTPRNGAMFGPVGHAYVYRSYGIHWCLNLVAGTEPGAAVLIRALEPTAGLEAMAERRGTGEVRLLCSGPGRLCQALGITLAQNGLPLDQAPFSLLERSGPVAVRQGRRIGITKGIETPWRFALAESRFLSKPLHP